MAKGGGFRDHWRWHRDKSLISPPNSYSFWNSGTGRYSLTQGGTVIRSSGVLMSSGFGLVVVRLYREQRESFTPYIKYFWWEILGKVPKKKKKKSMEFSITGGGGLPHSTLFLFFFMTVKVTIFSQISGIFLMFFLQIKPFKAKKFFGTYSIWMPLYPFFPGPKCSKSCQKTTRILPLHVEKKS